MPKIQIINHLKSDLSSEEAIQYVGVLIEKDLKDSAANLKKAVDSVLSRKEDDPSNALHVFKYSKNRQFVLHDLAIHANKEERLKNGEIHLFAVAASDEIFNTCFTQEGASKPSDYSIRQFFKKMLLKNEYANIVKEEIETSQLLQHKGTTALTAALVKFSMRAYARTLSVEQKQQTATATPSAERQEDSDEETLTSFKQFRLG